MFYLLPGPSNVNGTLMGASKKFKARFCARGDRQKEGVDYFETWAPVVQWQTVRLMMIFSSILSLESAQADITAAFVHAQPCRLKKMSTSNSLVVLKCTDHMVKSTSSNSRKHSMVLNKLLDTSSTTWPHISVDMVYANLTSTRASSLGLTL
jgi:hypothetical protein